MSGRTRAVVFWIATAAIFLVVNWQIAAKEALLREGRTVLLHLAPRDPRSLIQGDYMQLRYDLAVDPAVTRAVEGLSDGALVVTLDERGVASFARLHAGEPLAPGEALVRFRNRGNGGNGGEVRLGAESFLFQEGKAELYETARYGELKVDAAGNAVLAGLRDEELRPL
jgi:uncharacterized membrane-anchored protein